MQQFARPDAELMELAQAGWGPAFAVLVHRYGPMVLAACEDAKDPWQATLDVFARALRKLPQQDPDGDISAWLLGIARRPAPDHVPTADPEDLDALWLELDARWPDGRLPRRTPAVLKGVAVVVALIAVGILVPAAVFASGNGPTIPDTELDPIRAFPIEAEEDPEEDQEPEDEEPLPDFELPEVSTGPSAPPATTSPEPAPEAPPTPTPSPTPGPTPEPPSTEPAPDTSPVEPEADDQDVGDGDTGSTDDGVTDGAVPPVDDAVAEVPPSDGQDGGAADFVGPDA